MGHLITGSSGTPHITPKADAVWHRGLMGVESCILDYGEKLAPALIPSQPTNIRILDGCGMMQGRFFEIEEGSYDTIAIPNGAQGYNRIDIVCAKITQNENGTQTFSWEVVQGTQTTGTPTPPTVAEGSLDDGDEFALMPIASVELEGVSIVAVETVAEIGGTIQYLYGHRFIRREIWNNYSLTSAYGETDIVLGELSSFGNRIYDINWRLTYDNPVCKSDLMVFNNDNGLLYNRKVFAPKVGYNVSNNIIGYARNYYFYIDNGVLKLHLSQVETIKANAISTYDVDSGMCVPVRIYEWIYTGI